MSALTLPSDTGIIWARRGEVWHAHGAGDAHLDHGRKSACRRMSFGEQEELAAPGTAVTGALCSACFAEWCMGGRRPVNQELVIDAAELLELGAELLELKARGFVLHDDGWLCLRCGNVFEMTAAELPRECFCRGGPRG